MSDEAGRAAPETDYAGAFEDAELIEAETPDGATEFACSLFPGTPEELDVVVVAESREALEEGPREDLGDALGELGGLLAMAPSGDGDLSTVVLRDDRLGIGFRDPESNDEFTAVFERHEMPGGPDWRFVGFGEVEG